MGKKSREEFKRKVAALQTMSYEDLKKELAATEDSLKDIRKQKRKGAKVQSKGRLHNLRIYRREIWIEMNKRGSDEKKQVKVY